MENWQTPLVSVVIPTYNSARFIAQAVQSVLAQAYHRYEIIVINDGSTDETKEVLRKFDSHIQYLYQENRGPAAARNAGIKVAQGEYICFLDADDVWLPNKLEVQLAFIEKNREVGLIFSDEEEWDGEKVLHRSLLAKMLFRSDVLSQMPIQKAFRKLLIEDFIPTSMVMVRKACFAKAGLFDESLKVSEDRDMWCRIAAYFGIACLPLILGKKRVHESNISDNAELTHRSRIKLWENKRLQFPSLAPADVLDNLLADACLQLGYILLAKDQRKEARQAGWRSLTYAIRHIIKRRSADRSLPCYRWCLAIGLLPLTFLRWSITQSLWRVRNSLLAKS